MKKVDSILTIRYRKNLGSRSWDIVFEWEDILAKELKLVLKGEGYLKSRLRKILQTFGLYDFLSMIGVQNGISLQFVSDVKLRSFYTHEYNIIPIIIDFWYTDDEIPKFISYFRKAPLVFVTNKEVIKKIAKFNLPFPIEHFPLSLPDQYALKKEYCDNKIYDFAFIGRPNPFFESLLVRYSKEHPNFEYVFSRGISCNRVYYTNKGKYIGKDSGRVSYIEIIRKTKVSCYTTPGIDESKARTTEYNQVTPRVLEMLANGCQVIGHYPLSEDVLWYDLPSVVPNVDSYEQFRDCLDRMLNNSMDFDKVDCFLKKHYTTNSVYALKSALNKYKYV